MKIKKIILSLLITISLVVITNPLKVNALGETNAYISSGRQQHIVDYVNNYLNVYNQPFSKNWYVLYRTVYNEYILEFAEKSYKDQNGVMQYPMYSMNYESALGGHYTIGRNVNGQFEYGWERIIQVKLDANGNTSHVTKEFNIVTDLKQSNGMQNYIIYTNLPIVGGNYDGVTNKKFDLLEASKFSTPDVLQKTIFDYLIANTNILTGEYRYILTQQFSNITNGSGLIGYNLLLLPKYTNHRLYFNSTNNYYHLFYNNNPWSISNNGLLKSYAIRKTSPNSYSITDMTTFGINSVSTGLYPGIIFTSTVMFPYDETYTYGHGNMSSPPTFNVHSGYNQSAQLLLYTDMPLNGGPYHNMTLPWDKFEWAVVHNGEPQPLPDLINEPNPWEPELGDDPNWTPQPGDQIDYIDTGIDIVDWIANSVIKAVNTVIIFIGNFFTNLWNNLPQALLTPLLAIQQGIDVIAEADLPGVTPIIGFYQFIVDTGTSIIGIITLLVTTVVTTVIAFFTLIETLVLILPTPIRPLILFILSALSMLIIVKLFGLVLGFIGQLTGVVK